jgi:predicted RNA binding protein YcfA (HicA-like mRNA interferase family)
LSQREKRIAKLRARPPEADFDDVRAVLEDFGWVLGRQSGSHLTFTKANERILPIPLTGGRRVKRRYLDIICERLGLDELE